MDLRSLGAIVAVGDRSQGGYNQAAKFLPDAIISAAPGACDANSKVHELLSHWADIPQFLFEIPVDDTPEGKALGFMATFEEFPPRQEPGSFNLDQVLETLQSNPSTN